MKVIVHTDTSNRVWITVPNINTQNKFGEPERENITEEQALQRAWPLLPKDAINPQIVDWSEIPEDRTFRDGLVHRDGKVFHDIDKCREVWKVKVRLKRKTLLERLDVEYMTAQERGDVVAVSDVMKRKQELRDVTKMADQVGTVEELKLLHPACLRPK